MWPQTGLGANAQERRVLGRERDQGEIPERIIRQVAGGDGIEHHGDIPHGEQGVAVGRHAGHGFGCDVAGGARADLDEELRAEFFRQELGNQARDESDALPAAWPTMIFTGRAG
jgi:hypothetical protein